MAINHDGCRTLSWSELAGDRPVCSTFPCQCRYTDFLATSLKSIHRPFPLFERDAVFVVGEPHVKGLHGRIETARDCWVARPAEVRVEVTIELKHVAEIIGAWEIQSAVGVG